MSVDRVQKSRVDPAMVRSFGGEVLDKGCSRPVLLLPASFPVMAGALEVSLRSMEINIETFMSGDAVKVECHDFRRRPRACGSA